MNVSLQKSALDAPELNPELRSLFHRLNNQLGVILAHAELLESKASNDIERARAQQVVTAVLDAMGATRLIRQQTEITGVGITGTRVSM